MALHALVLNKQACIFNQLVPNALKEFPDAFVKYGEEHICIDLAYLFEAFA